MTVTETWMPYPKSPRFIVSDYGRVIGPSGIVLSPFLVGLGKYPAVTIDHKPRHVHRMVAETFIPRSTGRPEVNHKNGIKTDNRVDNLEWCSHSENVAHTYRVLNRRAHVGRGETHIRAILKDNEIAEIRRLRSAGMRLRPIASQFRVSVSHISHICRGKRRADTPLCVAKQDLI